MKDPDAVKPLIVRWCTKHNDSVIRWSDTTTGNFCSFAYINNPAKAEQQGCTLEKFYLQRFFRTKEGEILTDTEVEELIEFARAQIRWNRT